MNVDDGFGDVGREARHRRDTSQPTAVVVDRQHETGAGASTPLRPRHQHPQPRLAVHTQAGDEPGGRGEVALVDVEMQRRGGVAADGNAAHVPRVAVHEANASRRRLRGAVQHGG